MLFYLQFQMFNHENKSFTMKLVPSDSDKQAIPQMKAYWMFVLSRCWSQATFQLSNQKKKGPRCVAQRREVRNIMLVLSTCAHSRLTRGGKRVVFLDDTRFFTAQSLEANSWDWLSFQELCLHPVSVLLGNCQLVSPDGQGSCDLVSKAYHLQRE